MKFQIGRRWNSNSLLVELLVKMIFHINKEDHRGICFDALRYFSLSDVQLIVWLMRKIAK